MTVGVSTVHVVVGVPTPPLTLVSMEVGGPRVEGVAVVGVDQVVVGELGHQSVMVLVVLAYGGGA